MSLLARLARRPRPRLGGHDVAEARLLADAARDLGEPPRGCAWLADRTVEDLELGTVFTAIDRTRTITGAQVLWRWLVAPARELAVLDAREAAIGTLADPARRERVTRALGSSTSADAPHLPRLLWAELPRWPYGGVLAALALALVACAALVWWWPPAFLGVAVIFAANIVFDDWSKLRLAGGVRALEVLDDLLGRAAAAARAAPELATAVAQDLAIADRVHRRMRVLVVRDPFELLDLLRAGLLIRLAVTRSCLRLVEAERDRLRRIVVWFGELDALASVATLRAEHPALCVPELADGPPGLDARDLVHPAMPGAIGNDLALASSGLLVTGSNMSGKSTLLRTLGTNAILAQSIHTTSGTWRASLLHVRSVMRVVDAPAHGLSTYAVEVAAIRELVAADDDVPSLFLLDEPFHGTNPTARVPIVVAVLEHLVTTGLVVAATHDLDVATRIGPRFARGYFEEREGSFDRRLHAGIAPVSNAVEILRRAGYPAAIVDRLQAEPV